MRLTAALAGLVLTLACSEPAVEVAQRRDAFPLPPPGWGLGISVDQCPSGRAVSGSRTGGVMLAGEQLLTTGGTGLGQVVCVGDEITLIGSANGFTGYAPDASTRLAYNSSTTYALARTADGMRAVGSDSMGLALFEFNAGGSATAGPIPGVHDSVGALAFKADDPSHVFAFMFSSRTIEKIDVTSGATVGLGWPLPVMNGGQLVVGRFLGGGSVQFAIKSFEPTRGDGIRYFEESDTNPIAEVMFVRGTDSTFGRQLRVVDLNGVDALLVGDEANDRVVQYVGDASIVWASKAGANEGFGAGFSDEYVGAPEALGTSGTIYPTPALDRSRWYGLTCTPGDPCDAGPCRAVGACVGGVACLMGQYVSACVLPDGGPIVRDAGTDAGVGDGGTPDGGLASDGGPTSDGGPASDGGPPSDGGLDSDGGATADAGPPEPQADGGAQVGMNDAGELTTRVIFEARSCTSSPVEAGSVGLLILAIARGRRRR